MNSCTLSEGPSEAREVSTTMITSGSRARNEATFRGLKAIIDGSYPRGWFVAIHDEKIVADGGTLCELVQALVTLGKDPKASLAVQAGVDYHEFAHILLRAIETRPYPFSPRAVPARGDPWRADSFFPRTRRSDTGWS